MENIAFIDGQNLYSNTTFHKEKPWKVDINKFRIYLEKKYKVKKAYYFVGVNEEEIHNKLYEALQEAGFILVFRLHGPEMIGNKKGNIDVDLVFSVMKKMYKNEINDRVILVTGDGDYKKMVDFLIEENKFEKILFPSKDCASSLYRKIDIKYKLDLSDIGIQNKIGLK